LTKEFVLETTRTDDDKTPWRDLTPLIAPRSVAIVGASQRGADTKLAREPRGTQGTKAYLQLRDGPFQPEPFGPRARKKLE
jgi:hypothetical protein